MPNNGICPDTHSLKTSLYFAPKSCHVVYVEPQSSLSPLASPQSAAIAAAAAGPATAATVAIAAATPDPANAVTAATVTAASLLLPGAFFSPLLPSPPFLLLFVDYCRPLSFSLPPVFSTAISASLPMLVIMIVFVVKAAGLSL